MPVVSNDFIESFERMERRIAALAEQVRVLRAALDYVVNERESDLDMWHCPYSAKTQNEQYTAWMAAVKEAATWSC